MVLSVLKPHQQIRYIQLIIAFIIFLQFVDHVKSIKCFKCAVTVEKTYSYTKNITVITPMCSKFDKSEEYKVDCKYSTMCLKTISTLRLQNGQNLETVTRGCAPQKDTKQVFNNGRWNQEYSVQEVYEEGCKEVTENTMAASLKTHCYCRGDLCNKSNKIFNVKTVIVITALGALMICFQNKYI